MTTANSLIEAIRQKPDADAKVEELAVVLGTQVLALFNALLSVIGTVDETPGFNRESLRRDLEELKTLGLSDGIDRNLYAHTIDLCISRLGS